MEVRINDHPADITIDSEKTVGEVVAGLEQWISGSGHRLSGLSVDGSTVDLSSLEDVFAKDITSVKNINIITSSLAQLQAESLNFLLDDIKEYENLGFEEKKEYINTWKEKPQFLFISDQMPDLINYCVSLFSGGNIEANTVFSITEERLREVKNPLAEFLNLQSLVEETCRLLTDLPLDVQTGKDAKAAQTIQIFSGIAEKILRILKQLDIQGFLNLEADIEKQLTQMISEFGNLVRELLDAYEKYDTVLLGDLAEYEAAVRLKELFILIMNNSRQPEILGK